MHVYRVSFASFIVAAVILLAANASCELFLEAEPESREDVQFVNHELSCLHSDEASKSEWRMCIPGRRKRLPTFAQLRIAEKLKNGSFPQLEVPLNEAKCFHVDRYDVTTLIASPKCPALCRLRYSRPHHVCSGSLIQQIGTSGPTIITSPLYSCNLNYPRSYICVYNVSMLCSSDNVKVQPIRISLDKNDFVQVIDPTSSQINQPVNGSTWPDSQKIIPSSRFVFVFWSDKDATQSQGFKVKLECLLSKEEDNDQVGAGFGAPSAPGK